MNHVHIMGRLTRDPEVRYGNENNSVAKFTLAVDRRYKKQGEEQQADFISCVAFNKQAEFIEKYIKKGVKIIVTGRIQTGSYVNKDGQRVYTTDVICEEIEFAESKSNNAGAQQAEPSSAGDGFMNIPDGIDEELPFV